MSNVASKTIDVSADGQLEIIITETSQTGNNSNVNVSGRLINKGTALASHLVDDIDRKIYGPDGEYHPAGFHLNLAPGDTYEFINHTFLVPHNADGSKTTTFAVSYGDTQTSTFGQFKSLNTSLNLEQAVTVPSAPGIPQVTAITPDSVTLEWSASANNGGSTIVGYYVQYYNNTKASGPYINNFANNLSRTITGLKPGSWYTFIVYARNSIGYSNHGGALILRMPTGSHVRTTVTSSDGTTGDVSSWSLAIPYVRSGGKWKRAIPYVRTGGVWKQTH